MSTELQPHPIHANRPDSALHLLSRLLRYRVIVIGLPLLFLFSAYAISKFKGPRYSSESRFVPQRGSDASTPLASLGAQFGINLPGLSSGGESLEFYAELIKSPGILRKAVLSHYAAAGGRTLVDLYKKDATDPDQQIRNAIQQLGKDLGVGAVVRTGIITVTVRAKTPALAVEINDRLLDLLNQFNLESRQKKASAERQFVEGRLDEAHKEVVAAQSNLTSFYEQNRRIEQSPELRNRAADLERQVSFHQQVYTSLAQSVEEARIREVRNTPAITLIDAPSDWVRRTSRPAVISAALAAMLGTVIAVTLVLILDGFERQRREDPDSWLEVRQRLALRRTGRSQAR
jgi:uncharacterized protein involved in exopolysaccharide biosynthesis